MEKKSYNAPEAELIKIETSTMLAASVGIGKGEADAGQSFSNEHRGSWGNVWEKKQSLFNRMVMAYILSIQVTKNEFANNVIDPIKLMPSCSLSGMAFLIKESLYYVALKSNGRLAGFRISIVYYWCPIKNEVS